MQPTQQQRESSEHLPTVTLSLISHTNVGKTTLVRTLLRRDVGQVLDRAHVTEVSEVYELARCDSGVLRLWDTPGFGDSVRLLRRLQRHDRPLMWFVQQLWDRITDRPLWCGQQAVLNVRDEADLVLYLVNAAEEPQAAGYVAPELDLLSWMDRPVVLVLNQVGEAELSSELRRQRLESWRRHVARWPMVREVVELDAFSRCWVQENLLFDRLQPHLGAAKQELFGELSALWLRRNLAVFEQAVRAVAEYLALTAEDCESLPPGSTGLKRIFSDGEAMAEDKQRAIESLGQRLVTRTSQLMQELLDAHQLEGEAAMEIESQLGAFSVAGEEGLDTERGAFLGGVLSGALGGLAADLLAGGLTFGGGVLAGAILGALGGAGLSRGYRLVKGTGPPVIGWSAAFLERLVAQALVRYLAVAHFGRGRGEFEALEEPQRWGVAVAAAITIHDAEWQALWQRFGERKTKHPEPVARLQSLLDATARQILATGYPEAAAWLGIAAAGSAPSGSGEG